jgi:hypothetical protein
VLIGGRVTARNYAAQAQAGLMGSAAGFPTLDRSGVELLAGLIGTAVHFALPDDGKIFDDDLRGLAGQKLRLPYKRVTLEYYSPYDEAKPGPENPVYSPRRVIYLEEMDREKVLARREPYRQADDKDAAYLAPVPNPARLNGDSFILAMVAAQIDGVWRAMGATWMFQAEGWDEAATDPRYVGTLSARGEMGILMPNYAADLVKRLGVARARRTLGIDVEGELRAAMEFFEAVSCQNVVTSVGEHAAPPNVNARRARDGKLPINETKILAIDPGWLERHYRSSDGASSGLRASPRQHLRRGHIRRVHLDTPQQYQVWIPPTVVGDAERGRVDKSYQMGRRA